MKLLILITLLFTTTSNAKTTHDQAAQLGLTLTPFGAIKKGNEQGISRWLDVSSIDPSEQPLFTITFDNYQQYEANLTAGQIALLKTYPNSFEMPIYPSHRTFQAPGWVYDNTKINALNTSLNSEQTGILKSIGGIPFPIPQSAIEVYFNHITRWRGTQLISYASDANVSDHGKFQIYSRESIIRFDHYLPQKSAPNRLFSAISKITAPTTKSGSGGLVLEPIDQLKEPRSAWLWDKGRRRVIRAPNIAYDQPVNSANGLRTADDTDMINGSPDRFDWQMLEPRTLYIPYNNDQLANPQLTYQEILHKGHINPKTTRYELHRVWVIRANLKPQWRHLYQQRDFYIDEDSWSIAIVDQYDKQNQLFRVSLSYLRQNSDIPGTFPVINVFHDLNTNKYHVMGLQNEAPKKSSYQADLVKDNLFTTNGLKRYVK